VKTHTHTCTLTNMCAHTHARTCTHTFTRAHTHTSPPGETGFLDFSIFISLRAVCAITEEALSSPGSVVCSMSSVCFHCSRRPPHFTRGNVSLLKALHTCA